MDPLTLYLAKLLGFYLVIVAVSFGLRKQETLALIDAWLDNGPLNLLGSLMTVGIGLAIILGHNVWSGGALTVAVTLCGWAILLKGAMLLLLPPNRMITTYRALGYDRYFHLYMGGTLLLGLAMIFAAWTT